jgi:spoIIIJ-associated protein
MQAIEQSGRTVEDAVQAALKALGVARDEVEVKVRVTVKAGLAQRALDLLGDILRLMSIDARAEITSDDPDGVHIDIHDTPDLGLLIGKRGQTLAALQLIVAMIANREQAPEKRRRIILDAEGYRARRENTLRAMARDAAERAKRSGRPVTLEALTPRERRVVHVALSGDPAVTTRSEGEEPNRSVIVAPRRNRGT